MKWIYFVVIAVFSTSCANRFYNPNRIYTPLFKNRGDLNLDASVSLANTQADLTLGYSPLKYFGCYLGTTQLGETQITVNSGYVYRYRGPVNSVGAGLYLAESQSKTYRLEVFYEYSGGKFKNTQGFNPSDYYMNGWIRRNAAIANLGYTGPGQRLEFAYSLRAGAVVLGGLSTNNQSVWKSYIEQYNTKQQFTVVEQGLTIRYGWEKVKFQLQGNLYRNVGINSDTEYALPTGDFDLRFGLAFKLNTSGFGRKHFPKNNSGTN